MKKISSKHFMHYDKDSDVLYFGVKEGNEEESIEVSPGVSVEVDQSGRVIGIEILNASHIMQSLIKTSGASLPQRRPKSAIR